MLRDFRSHASELTALALHMERELREALEVKALDIQFVSSRLKSEESLRKKLARPDKTYRRLWDVTDLVGLRVATYFEDSIEDVARLVEERFVVDYRHSVDKLRVRDHGTFGYRSVHYVCSVPPELSPSGELRVEIQIRTALQHAWAEVEHDLGYKALVDGAAEGGAAVPAQIRRRFSRIASLLEIADQEFVSIRSELRGYRDRAREEGQQGGRGVPIDALSLDGVTRAPSLAWLDLSIAEALAKPVSDEVFFPGYLARMLAHAGITTTPALHAACAEHAPHVLAMVVPYFAFARGALALDVDNLPAIQRGYGLFFVAHRAIVRGPELGLSKVARLTRMYAELDFAGDEKRAHEIASGLLSALG